MADGSDPSNKPDHLALRAGETDQSAVIGVSAAAGRDHFVGGQIGKAEASARVQWSMHYDGELYRALPSGRTSTYSNHSQADPGRYNLPGQSTLYTAPTIADVRAETANYSGLNGRAVTRSHFEGDLLDLRETSGVRYGALTQGHGSDGKMRSRLVRITGERPYTLPRALGDVARERGLSGVIAPANHGNTNVALFPDNPNQETRTPGRIEAGLHAIDHRIVTVDGLGNEAFGTATPYAQPHPHIPDTTPHKSAPPGIDLNPVKNPDGKVTGREGYLENIRDDVETHGRAGGSRYGALGAGAGELTEWATRGHVDGNGALANVALGAMAGHAETALAHGIDRLVSPNPSPPNVAGAAGIEMPAAASRLRPPGLAAGGAAAGLVGAAFGGADAAWQDADAVKHDRMTAGRATADVVVQTGIGVGSGMAAAATGAAVGSVVPVVGTAAGAVAGFGVGLGVSLVAEHSAALHAGEQALGDALTRHAEQPLQHVWRGVAATVDAVNGTVTGAEHHVAETVKGAAAAAEQAAVSRWHQLMGSAAAQAPAPTAAEHGRQPSREKAAEAAPARTPAAGRTIGDTANSVAPTEQAFVYDWHRLTGSAAAQTPASTPVERGAQSVWAAQAEQGRQLKQEPPAAAAVQTQGAAPASAGQGLRLG